LSKIINGGKSDKHIIKPYKFKSLNEIKNDADEFKTFSQTAAEERIVEEKEPVNVNESNNGVVERLLEKIEELSNNFIKSQMEFEKEIKKCHEEAQQKIKAAFDEGFNKGLAQAKSECENELKETQKLYEDSVKKLEEIATIFNKQIENIEKELISVALDIAKEVIQKEISENSQEIAYNLAKSLMQDLKEASKVKIKVNPEDAKYLKEKIKGVEIIEDEAVKKGGIVIMSDVGNIDAQIEDRFNAAKEAVLKG